MKPMTWRRRSAFTLVELMIVVALIALLAVMALPGFLRARQRSQNVRFINALRVIRDAFEIYAGEHKAYPPDELRGILPAGMAGYLGPTLDFTAPTPVGGSWDWDADEYGFQSGISVVGPTADLTQLTAIDVQIDDGNLETGILRHSAPARYTYVLQ